MSVPQLFANIKKVVKIRNFAERAVIDGAIFRLHYRTTMGIFLACSVFVTAYTMFGEPIQCIGDTKEAPKLKVMNTYCYLGFTYTLPERLGTGRTTDELEKTHGLGPSNGDTTKKFHSYYRWVPLMLFLQGISFYVPYWIWKQWEGKTITQLTKGLRGPAIATVEEDQKRLKRLAIYAKESLHTHNGFALMYFFCELLNLINVILSMVTIDAFLDGEFSRYGLRVLEFTFNDDQYNRVDPMIKIFPRLTKCDFHKYGASGDIQVYDHMCVLALNNLNEKIYIFLWFWLSVLAVVSIIPIVYNIALLVFPYVREKALGMNYISHGEPVIERLNRKLQIGDYFLFQLLGKNMNSKFFRGFVDEVHNLLVGEPDKKKNAYAFEKE